MEEAFLAALAEEELPPPEHQLFIDQLDSSARRMSAAARRGEPSCR
jgi:hypothetical protein